MRIAFVCAVIVLVLLITWFEWPKMNPRHKKEKIAFGILMFAGFALSAILIYFPNMYGPIDFVNQLFGSIGEAILGKK